MSSCSVSSRILNIKFSAPSCGPKNAEELDYYQKLTSDLRGNKFSSAVGWLISLGKELEEDGNRRIRELQKDLQFSRSVMERNVCGYCICLYFLEKVSTRSNNSIVSYSDNGCCICFFCGFYLPV